MTESVARQEAIPDAATRRRLVEAMPLPANIQALVDSAVEDAGDRTVWTFFDEDESLTYRAMRDTVARLAHAFRAHGIHKGTHVAVMLPNIPAWPLSWLAIGYIGAVTVPVNAAYRPRELAYVLNDSDAEYLIIGTEQLAVYREARSENLIALPEDRLILVGDDEQGVESWQRMLDDASDGPFHAVEPVGHDDLLNIQYTSGTTGFPKGCMLTQRYWIQAGLVNAFRDGLSYRNLLASTPFFYMDPQWILLMTLYHRGTLFVARRQSTSRFLGWLRDYHINFCLMPVVMMKQPELPDDGVNEVVRANVYVMPPALHHPFEERFHVTAREAFGMTEVGPTMFVPAEASDMVGSGSCGMPGPFRECRVVGEDGRPLPVGEIGELQIKGPGMLLGYYKRPEATAAALDGGWFHTGDLARTDARGFFYIVGRNKDMIRRAAENIAAKEVEAVLMAHQDVVEVAAIPVPDDIRGEEVKACIVLREALRSDRRPVDTLTALIDHCRERLAPFKVPRYYEFRESLPKTASLKIAKQTLKDEKSDLRTGSFDRVEGRWLG
ncbi:ATP-dependent acyl-CoA ligase [Rhodospirillaceae bacterium KN72]|uniref:ATP-dependent acyl-CoA ligase n=1 Tax=Pacificispira spongiicola TaxID=2729598 RepID=A0A7Y0DWX2_9PROT|nr:AMP-binding protein [Pacificispira spongiicola]NMM43114.1 ATP-dependent acyl-CoA ligase [Pacificispira spongiicola]